MYSTVYLDNLTLSTFTNYLSSREAALDLPLGPQIALLCVLKLSA
jgi:hypothetical protein